MKIIAKIHTPFDEKFGIPRQSGLVSVRSRIVFEPKYRIPEAIRGIEGYSHLWLIWNFSQAERKDWSPTVRPPRLGGNRRVGVFATRSPFRPNPIGLSSVRLIAVEHTDELGDVLVVEGADILDGTPIYDIKPYLAYTDAHPDATSGFAAEVFDYSLEVKLAENVGKALSRDEWEELKQILSQDPRPAYQADGKQYGMKYRSREITFTVNGSVLTVTDIR